MLRSIYFFSFVLILWTCWDECCAKGVRQRRDSKQEYAVTNYEIGRLIGQLGRKIKDLDSKLYRQELREIQTDETTAKALESLHSDHAIQQKNMQTVAGNLGKLSQTIVGVGSLIKTIDGRQRKMLNNMNEGFNRLLKITTSSDSKQEVTTILTKVDTMDDVLKSSIKGVMNEVKIVEESLRQHMEQLTARHDRLWSDWTACQNDQIRALTEVTSSLSQTESHFADQITESKSSSLTSTNGGLSANCDGLSTNDMSVRMNSLEKAYQNRDQQFSDQSDKIYTILKEQNNDLRKLLNITKLETTTMDNSFKDILNNLKSLQSKSEESLNSVVATIKRISEENAQQISKKVQEISTNVNKNSDTVLNTLEDSASMSENIQSSLTENFEDLTRDIKSLKKVEKVMMNTADSVLDTKRSIEFGIKQVILELGDIVKNSGHTINNTISERINRISFDIVNNQTSAITEMTSKMENEISQVWRQIGIMYQQVSQSVNILNQLQDSTANHMNESLDQVGNIDGTVGNINGKVTDMEDNLNFLLGRLSLVSSEFSNMKYSIGAELDKLREMSKEFSSLEEYEKSDNYDDNQSEQTLT